MGFDYELIYCAAIWSIENSSMCPGSIVYYRTAINDKWPKIDKLYYFPFLNSRTGQIEGIRVDPQTHTKKVEILKARQQPLNPLPHNDALKIYSCRKHCEKKRNCL